MLINRSLQPKATPSGGVSYIIRTAELPNVDISLYYGSDLLETKNTGENGGVVDFNVQQTGTYRVTASKMISGMTTAMWKTNIEVNEIGIHNAKSTYGLDKYTWQEIKQASLGDYARYMWSVGDIKYMSSFMGSTSQTYTKCTITTFDKNTKADGSGRNTIGWIIGRTNSTYSHWTSGGLVGTSWIGSLIRKNGLKSGEVQYIYDNTVTSATEGTYYTLNKDGRTFDEAILPDAFNSRNKYYIKTINEEDGAFIAGLPDDIKHLVEQVEVETWAGFGGNITTSTQAKADKTVIITKDWIWLPSDSEIFGDNVADRYTTTYSNVGLEGRTFDLYKNYIEKNFNSGVTSWLRSPTTSYLDSVCTWSSAGYISSNGGQYGSYARLCFCI